MNETTSAQTNPNGPAPNPAVFRALDYCRERAISILARAMRDTLHRLGTNAGDGVSGATFAFARRQQRELEASFRRALGSRFGSAATGYEAQVDWHFGERLCQEPGLLHDVVTRELALEVNLAAHDAYLAFDQEMRALLGDPEWDESSNPLAPSLIAGAIADAAQVTGAPRVIAFTLTAYLMHGMARTISALYGELAHYLASKADRAPAATELSPDDTMAIEVWDPTEEGPEMMSVLQHLVPGEAAEGSENAPPFDTQAWVAELQRVEADSLAMELRAGRLETPPDRTLLRGLIQTPAAANLQRHERVVLDVVGRMFEFMLNGSGVPMAVKQALSRMQIPVLKVALRDPDFFGHEVHPARQLINEIAAASLGWDEDSLLYAHLVRKATELAQTLLNRFDSDLKVFEDSLTVFREFVQQQQRQPDRAAEALMTWLEREEQSHAAHAAARRAAEAAIGGRVADPEIPDSVRVFLCREWIKPLQAAYLEGGDTGPAWHAAISMMDDLIWSVRPKLTHDSRYYLVKTLPALLRRLQQEMTKADIAQEVRDEFMSRLVICHAQAVKSGYQPETAQPLAEDAWKSVALARAAQAEVAVVLPFEPPEAEPGESTVALRFVDPRAVSAAPVEETLSVGELDAGAGAPSAANLTPGSWVEFQYGRGDSYVARLKWVSPVKRTYLFVDREGRRVATMAEAQLDIALRGGAARVVEYTPLVDRAMSHVMEALKHAAAA